MRKEQLQPLRRLRIMVPIGNFRKLISGPVMALVQASSVAETQASESFAPWLRKAEFNSALSYVGLAFGECPVSDKELSDLVGDEFLRARLRRANSLRFFLKVEIHCWDQHYSGGERAGTAIFSRVGFSSLTDPARGSLDYSKHMEVLGLQIDTDDSGLSFLKNKLREEISSALATYLRANTRD